MRKLSLLPFLIFNFSFLIEVYAQQDPQYSQYMFNQLAVNPAYAGNRDVLSSTVLYRDQWTGIDGGPTTASLSLQTPLQEKKAGAGLEILSDKMGLKRTNAFLVSYAYRMQFLKGKLAMGLRSGFYNYVFDWDRVKVKDKTDVVNTGVQSSKTSVTADFGMYYYTKTFYWGLGLTHLNRGKITDHSSADLASRQSIHFFMPIGMSFLKGTTVLNPSLMIKGAGHAPLEVDLNFNMLLKERFWLGISLRTRYGIVFMTQYLVSDKLKIGYSYDYGINGIGTIGKGTHEIMLGYDINFKGAKMETLRYF